MTGREEMTRCNHSGSSHMNDQGTKRQVFKVLSSHDLTGENRERLPKRWWEGLDLYLVRKQKQRPERWLSG